MLDQHDRPIQSIPPNPNSLDLAKATRGLQGLRDALRGKKFDHDKPRWDLLPYDAVGAVVDVLTHGCEKYGPENWRQVEGWQRRYFAAAQRHLVAYFQGDDTDDESGLPHLAHAACCVLFLLAKEMEET
jgi:hypothetical protein